MNGKHIPLHTDLRLGFKKMVCITIKDLLLHTVDNMTVLEAISADYLVVSDIQYATVWFEGQPTSLRNSDQFLYVTEETAALLPKKMEISEYTA